jgi:hypothetical protein
MKRGGVSLQRKGPKSLKKTILTPWLKQQWCIGPMTGDYIWHREDVLAQYAKPSDPLCPRICFDERPCQILGAVLGPWPMKPGKPLRSDYEYERHGTCGGLLAFEPHTGFRYVEVRAQRTAVDYAQFMPNLGTRSSPTVNPICLIQDN